MIIIYIIISEVSQFWKIIYLRKVKSFSYLKEHYLSKLNHRFNLFQLPIFRELNTLRNT